MLKINELMNQSKEDLEVQCEQMSRDIFHLQSELRMSKKLEKPHELKNKKKDRARILTALNKKRLTS